MIFWDSKGYSAPTPAMVISLNLLQHRKLQYISHPPPFFFVCLGKVAPILMLPVFSSSISVAKIQPHL